MKNPNVLFLIVDDLRPQLGCYGKLGMHTPHIDAFAESGTLFERHICQQAICMASRGSMFTGQRPDYGHIYNCESVESNLPNAYTLHRHFAASGYDVFGSGKVYHYESDNERQFGDRYIDAPSDSFGRGYASEASRRDVAELARAWQAEGKSGPSGGRGRPFECADVSDESYRDGARSRVVAETLRAFRGADRPFFLGVGMLKPHLPFSAPRKYWDLYDRDAIRLPDNQFVPPESHQNNPYNYGELRNYLGVPSGSDPLPDDLARELIHGYYACVSYLDAQIGIMLDALDETGLAENTIVVLTADHGFKLGEHSLWCKHTAFIPDYHIPLLVRAPGVTTPGSRVRGFSESVDFYPSLCELAGIATPPGLAGRSLRANLADANAPTADAAFTQWPQLRHDPKEAIFGYTILTQEFRYTEWTHRASGEVKGRELFDLRTDPGENECVAGRAGFADVEAELSGRLRTMNGLRA